MSEWVKLDELYEIQDLKKHLDYNHIVNEIKDDVFISIKTEADIEVLLTRQKWWIATVKLGNIYRCDMNVKRMKIDGTSLEYTTMWIEGACADMIYLKPIMF
jgi:hypothetical protein